MLSFIRVFGVYIVTAALLTWALFAFGWSEVLELPGFEGPKTPSATPVILAEKSPPPAAPVATAPAPQPQQPRKIVTEPPMPRSPPPVPAAPVVRAPEPPPIVVAAPPKPPAEPAPSRVVAPPQPTAPKAVAAPPVASPPGEPARAAVPPPPPPPVAVVPPRAAPTQRVTEAAPIPAPRSEPPRPAAQPAPQTRAPAAAFSARWAPVRRVAGFGPDALIDQLDDQRRPGDDVPCVAFERVRFRAGTAQPVRNTRAELDLMATGLGANPLSRVEVGSRIGTTRMTLANQRLAAERARFVHDELVRRGIARARLRVDTATAYHVLMEEVVRLNGTRTPSVGLCVLPASRS